MSTNSPKPSLGQLKTAAQLQMAFALIIASAIKDLGSVPNGHIYSMVCGVIDFTSYTTIITWLKNRKFIEEKNNLLIWIGDKTSDIEKSSENVKS